MRTDWKLLALANSGGGGGTSALADLSDVNITDPTNNQVLAYNESTNSWGNKTAGEDVHVESGEIVEITNTFYAWSRTASWGEDTVYTTSETPNVDDQTYAKSGDDISLDGGKVTAFDTNTITVYYDAEGPYYYPRKSEYDEQGTESKKVIELTLTDSNKVEIDLDPLSEDYVAKPATEGTSGQVLSTNGDGTTQWIDAGGSDEYMPKENPVGTGKFAMNASASDISSMGENAILLNGWGCAATGQYSFAEGFSNGATNTAAHAEGRANAASGLYSHAEGFRTKSQKDASHSEGQDTTASGNYAHAEGYSTTASNSASHAEGSSTTANGANSHAEGGGSSTKNTAQSSHAEGNYTRANASYSHAEGNYTIASGESQHVQGKFNIEDTVNTYADIVGGGTSDSNRANIETLDWSGNLWVAGDITDGSGNVLSDIASRIANIEATLSRLTNGGA